MTAQAHLKNAAYGVRRITEGWRRHPGVRSGGELTRGERAADTMRNGMGSWGFVFGAVGFLIAWIALNVILDRSNGHTFDQYPFILLNLVLSCVAALQGAILLIAAKRSDQVSSELAQHDYDADCRSRELLESLTTEFAALTVQHAEQSRQLAALMEKVGAVAAITQHAGHVATPAEQTVPAPHQTE
jgi:uncharacterized membrane protein